MIDRAPLLFALQSTRELGDRVAAALGVPLSPHEERGFEDGEHKVRPLVSVRGHDVKPRDPVTTRYVASLFEAVGTDCVVTLDVHSLAAFQNAFRCRTEHLEAKNLFAEGIWVCTVSTPFGWGRLLLTKRATANAPSGRRGGAAQGGSARRAAGSPRTLPDPAGRSPPWPRPWGGPGSPGCTRR